MDRSLERERGGGGKEREGEGDSLFIKANLTRAKMLEEQLCVRND
jgi:hypothetical protein